MNTKDVVLVCDKGNNSEPNISKVVKEMHIVGSVTHGQVKDLAHVPLSKYVHMYTNQKAIESKATEPKKNCSGWSSPWSFHLTSTHTRDNPRRMIKTSERYLKKTQGPE
ncbi:MAG: hypothetical protein DRO89_05300 [Candidatus Altiarchaeales archaeon]|nr:MAG: hypothetical protein DRO89_05300 [Candidatus Altiarchaeales archaeon]